MALREVRIYTPKITTKEDVDSLRDNRPFLMKTEIPVESQFINVCSVPSLLDMMGFSGGGGPPAYAYVVDPDCKETRKVIFASVTPNNPIPVQKTEGAVFKGHFEITGPMVESGAFEEVMSSSGLILEMVPYQVPPALKALYTPEIQKQLEAIRAAAKVSPIGNPGGANQPGGAGTPR
jgi:hypothetical protein